MVKKLTEQEIIESFEICYLGSQNCEACPFTVHKLECRGGRMDVEVYNLLKRQKAEIERLTEELATAKQELVNEQRYYENAYSKACQLETQTAKLQKQVDELTDHLSEKQNALWDLQDDFDNLLDEGKQQTVKDTAKEILGLILAKEFEKGDYLTDDELHELFKERYGVEVE